MAELEAEVRAQLKELNVPEKHAELIKHLIVLTREEAKKRISNKYLAATAVTNPDKGAICLILDFRWTLAHEVGHLVWRTSLSQDTKHSYRELMEREKEEWERIVGKVLSKFYPEVFGNIDPHSEEWEEEFCWNYAFYLCMEDFSTLHPKTYDWLKRHVFADGQDL